MTTEIITVLAVIAGIAWLGVMLVAAFRNRGGEEVPPNLQPGIDDQQLETRRLEGGQKAAIVFSAFLAVALPLHFLSEPSRQAGFVEEFAEASVSRGESLAIEFACFSCHGPLGAGGVARFVEQRSGVTVDWLTPRLDDIFYRYGDDEVAFWITYGRPNTPMPPWGLAGGGPMNEHQVQDLVSYLRTIQRPQQEVANQAAAAPGSEAARLAGADAAVEAAIIDQLQVIAEMDQAPEDLAFVGPLAERARQVFDGAGSGFDTDADGLSDVAEVELTEISEAAYLYFQAFDPIQLDPEVADAELFDEAMDRLRQAAQRDPILRPQVDVIERILETAEGEDTDGDGIPDAAETRINAQLTEAARATIPGEVATVVRLDPSNPETTSGVPDRTAASRLVGALESVAVAKRVLVENEDRIRPAEEAGLAFLRQAQRERRWDVDVPGVAAAMGATEGEAARAVGLFNANCARCHTAGFSAGMAFTQEVGSGGFGPALWEGRPVVQFGEAPTDETQTDLLVDFLTNGSEPQRPYGLNGVGTGRMPGFGPVLPESDIELLARYLRSGNLSGREE